MQTQREKTTRRTTLRRRADGARRLIAVSLIGLVVGSGTSMGSAPDVPRAAVTAPAAATRDAAEPDAGEPGAARFRSIPGAESLVVAEIPGPGAVEQRATILDVHAAGTGNASPADDDDQGVAHAPPPGGDDHGHDTGGSTPAASGRDPLACTGYPEPRTFIEVQDWWVATPGLDGDDFGHVHVGTCFPYQQHIRGVAEFDLRVVMHENPGHLRRVDVAIYAADDSGLVVPVEFDARCDGTCVFWATARVDTRSVSDGWQEFRFKARVTQPNGDEMLTSSGWKTYLDNGNPVHGSDGGSGVTARGWYTDVGYQNAYIDAIPTGPVSGTWSFTLKLVPGADGTPTTSHLVAVDPDFHMGHPGVVIKAGPGECRCTVSIETTQFANGPHRLFLRSDSALDSGTTHSGVLAFVFVVHNP